MTMTRRRDGSGRRARETYGSVGVELDGAVLVVLDVLGQPQTLHQQRVTQQADDGAHDEGHEQVDVDHVPLAVQTSVRPMQGA